MQEVFKLLMTGSITAGQFTTRVKALEAKLPAGVGWRFGDYIS